MIGLAQIKMLGPTGTPFGGHLDESLGCTEWNIEKSTSYQTLLRCSRDTLAEPQQAGTWQGCLHAAPWS